MFNEHGKAVIRLGDRTDHDGTVTSACDIVALGKQVATETCMTYCPRCGGDFEILPGGGTRRHLGKALAYDGDQTACGARLISSLAKQTPLP